ncbi:MAG: Kyphoscoliosis peptidase [Rudanella sp.]|nr:Kyphoscoliosis peptidase [Rudanella sp.]
MRKYTIGLSLALLLLLTGTGFVATSSRGFRVYNLFEQTNTVNRASTEIPLNSRFVTVDYSTIDQYAKNTPESKAANLNSLANYLTAPARSELAKARSVYAWITSHVRYDLNAFGNGTYYSEVDYANRTLRSRRAVCTGYSLLFKHLLNKSGIDVANVKGYSRTEDATAGQPTGPMDHEWNALKLDGHSYLIDLTWAMTTGKSGRPNDHYFLTDPRAFVSQHLPADPRWQLLNPAISKATFDRFPKLYDAYFRMGFNERFPQNGLIHTNDVATITFRNDADLKIVCSAARPGQNTGQTIPSSLQRNGDTYTLSVRVPQRGPTTLYVFAKPKTSANAPYRQYEAIGSFTVVKG